MNVPTDRDIALVRAALEAAAALAEDGECFPSCNSYFHDDLCPIVNPGTAIRALDPAAIAMTVEESPAEEAALELARAVLEAAASQLEEQAHRARTDMFQYSTPTEGMMLMQEARFADAAALRQMAKEIK